MMNRAIEELRTPPGTAAPFDGACRYLISLDFDGTLLCEETRCIPSAFFDMMQHWRAHGVRWGINTGRSLPYLMQDLRPCAPFLPDFICTCERYIYMADAAGHLLPDTAHNAECAAINAAVRARFAPVLQQMMLQLARQHPEWQWEYAADDPLSIEAVDAATMDAMAPDMKRLADEMRALGVRPGIWVRYLINGKDNEPRTREPRSCTWHSVGAYLFHTLQSWEMVTTICTPFKLYPQHFAPLRLRRIRKFARGYALMAVMFLPKPGCCKLSMPGPNAIFCKREALSNPADQ